MIPISNNLVRIMNRSKSLRTLTASLGFLALPAVTAVLINSPITQAISISVPESIQLSLIPGKTAQTSPTSIIVNANDASAGYTISLSAPDSNTTGALTGTKGGTIATVAAGTNFLSEANFTGDNTWGIKHCTVETTASACLSTAVYEPAPKGGASPTPLVIDAPQTHNSQPVEYALAIGAKISNDIAVDTYSGSFTLATVANVEGYEIVYVDPLSGMPAPEKGSSNPASIDLSNAEPTKTGYEFAGWCSVYITDGDCEGHNGTVYAKGATYYLSNGAYTNLYAIWKPQYSVKYHNNGVGSLIGTGEFSGFGSSFAVKAATDVISSISSSYTFLGWCTVASGGETCSGGTKYVAGASISVSTPMTTPLNLYAMWHTDKLYLQDINSWKTSSIPNDGDTMTVYDRRDEKPYTVGRIKEGSYNKIWLLDNLALEVTTSNLSSSDTNVPSNWPGWTTNGNSKKLPASANTGFSDYEKPMINTDSISRTKDNVTGNNTGTDSLAEASSWKFGVYYNYCAASAGYGCTNSSTSPGDMTYDICPSGWHIPSGGASGEYQELSTLLNGATGNISDAAKTQAFRKKLHLPLSGNFNSSSANNQGSYGYFWSSSSYPSYANSMYYLYVNASNVYPQNNYYRYYGFTVRCVAPGV